MAASIGKKPTKKLVRPTPQNVGDVRIRVLRGPSADGKWYWRAGRNSGGKETPVWTGWGTASDAVAAVAALVAQGPNAKRDRSHNAVETVRDLCAVYLANREDEPGLDETTIPTLRNMLRRVADGIGEVRLDRLDRTTLERHRDARLRAGSAASSIRAELVRLRAAWVWGQEPEIGITPTRVLPRIKVKGATKNCSTTPDRQQIEAVVGKLEGWLRVAVLLYAATGARLGELSCVQWGDDGREDERRTVGAVHLSRDEPVIHVVGKSGRHRNIPIEPPVLKLLVAWRATATSAAVWPVTPQTVVAKVAPALRAACAAVKVPRFTAQGLRRAVVDLLYVPGNDPASAASVMGHSPAVAMQHYRRVKDADRRVTVKRAKLGHFSAIALNPAPALSPVAPQVRRRAREKAEKAAANTALPGVPARASGEVGPSQETVTDGKNRL